MPPARPRYDDVALTIVATVVSRRDGRAILDAGSKALSSDTAVEGGFGHVLEAPGSTLEQLNEEHGYLALGGADDLELGQQVRIVPNHVCVAVNLFDELIGVDGGRPSFAGRSHAAAEHAGRPGCCPPHPLVLTNVTERSAGPRVAADVAGLDLEDVLPVGVPAGVEAALQPEVEEPRRVRMVLGGVGRVYGPEVDVGGGLPCTFG